MLYHERAIFLPLFNLGQEKVASLLLEGAHIRQGYGPNLPNNTQIMMLSGLKSTSNSKIRIQGSCSTVLPSQSLAPVFVYVFCLIIYSELAQWSTEHPVRFFGRECDAVSEPALAWAWAQSRVCNSRFWQLSILHMVTVSTVASAPSWGPCWRLESPCTFSPSLQGAAAHQGNL